MYFLTENEYEYLKKYHGVVGKYWEFPTCNRFAFKGKMEKTVLAGDEVNVFEADEVEILYPINRVSLRFYYTPNWYFNIYDYNWIEVIKSWFNH